MIFAVLGLLMVGIGLFGTAVAIFVFIISIYTEIPFPPTHWGLSVQFSIVVGCGLFLVGAVIELRRADSFVSRQFDARAPTTEERDRVGPHIRRLAQQFDIPEPTIHITDTRATHVSVSGLSKQRATLVISTSVLSSLTDAELEGVLAHELAHIVNRDATVCTIVSIPSMIADTLMTWRPDFESNDPNQPTTYTLYDLVGMFFWLLSRPFVSMFTQQREYVADAAAAKATGNPSAIASALQTLSKQTTDLPSDDLRTASAVAAFSIVRPDSTIDPEYWPNGRPPLSVQIKERRLPTHPPIETRIERLKKVTTETV